MNREAADTVIDWNGYAERAIAQAARQRVQSELKVLDTGDGAGTPSMTR